MISITFNTGDRQPVPRGIVRADTLSLLLPLLKKRKGSFPGMASAYRFELHGGAEEGYVWTFYRGKDPLTTTGLALNGESSAKLWGLLERMYFDTAGALTKALGSEGFGTAVVEMPDETPWGATILLPALGMVSQQDAGFIGHMAICFAEILKDWEV